MTIQQVPVQFQQGYAGYGPADWQRQQAILNGQQQPAAQPARRQQGLSFLLHGDAKAGKSNLADSGPQPRVILDIEGTANWTVSRKIEWDPARQTVPVLDRHLTAGYGQPSITPAWESALVLTREPAVIDRVYQVLWSGRHPFNSASVDSVTEFQQRIIDDLVGLRQLQQGHWGTLLRTVNWTVRKWRDLIVHPSRPLWSVSFVAGTHFDQRKGKWRPLVQGSGQDYLPYYVDVLGYVYAQQDGSRFVLTGPHPQYETGERVGGRLPAIMPVAYPGRAGWSAESMVRQVLTGG